MPTGESGNDLKNKSLVVHVDLGSQSEPNPFLTMKPIKEYENIHFHFHYNKDKPTVDKKPDVTPTKPFHTPDFKEEPKIKKTNAELNEEEVKSNGKQQKNGQMETDTFESNMNKPGWVKKLENQRFIISTWILYLEREFLELSHIKHKYKVLYEYVTDEMSKLEPAIIDDDIDTIDQISERMMFNTCGNGFILRRNLNSQQGDQQYNLNLLDKKINEILEMIVKKHGLFLSKSKTMELTSFEKQNIAKSRLDTYVMNREKSAINSLVRISQEKLNAVHHEMLGGVKISEEIHEIMENFQSFGRDKFSDQIDTATPDDLLQCFRRYN